MNNLENGLNALYPMLTKEFMILINLLIIY
jgi:hypothetical protein